MDLFTFQFTCLVVGQEAGSMVVSRHFVQNVLERLSQSELAQDSVVAVYQRLLEILQTRAISYEDQVTTATFLFLHIFRCV